MINYFNLLNLNNILLSPLNYLIALFFFVGVCTLAIFFQNINNKLKKESFLIIFLLIICFLVFLTNIVLLTKTNLDYIKFLIYFFCILGLIFPLFFKKNLFNYFKYINENNSLIIKIILFLIFLNSILSPIDIDSLDYHIGFPAFIENKGYYEAQINWFHSAFFFNGEIIGLLGLLINTDMILNLLNFISILIFFRTVEITKYNTYSKNLIKLIIITCPAVIQLILSAKPFLFPLSIMVYAFYQLKNLFHIGKTCQKETNNPLVLFVIIFFGCSFRYELYIFQFIIILYFLIYRYSQVIRIASFSLLGFLVSIFPIFFRNFIYFKDPIFPFLSKKILGEEYISFINGLGSTGSFYGIDKILIFPLNLFISAVPEYFITTLGIVILPVLIKLKKKFINEDIYIIILYCFILLLLGKTAYPRFFLPSFIILLFMFGLILGNFKSKLFRTILFGHILFSISIFLYSLILYGPMLINEKIKDKIFNKTVENHHVYSSIYREYGNQIKFLDITRSRNNFDKLKLNIEFDNKTNHMSYDDLFRSISDTSDYILIEKEFENYLINKKVQFKIIKKYENKIQTRNPLFQKNTKILIIKLIK